MHKASKRRGERERATPRVRHGPVAKNRIAPLPHQLPRREDLGLEMPPSGGPRPLLVAGTAVV